MILPFNDPESAYQYSKKLGRRIIEAEELILKDVAFCFPYARYIVKGRWIEGEDVLKTSSIHSCWYAQYVLHDRFPKGESTIRGYSGLIWGDYIQFLRQQNYTQQDQIQWIKNGVTEDLVCVLNSLGMSEEVQTVLITQRPDLISKIDDLSQSMKNRYSHELGLSGIEI
jgi:hypothetical protein